MKGSDRVRVPPIKCQGIKTKLVAFIRENLQWQKTGASRWVEPFLGSGVVAFNLAPQRALLSDTNHHIIRFYQAIQQGEITADRVRHFLTYEGSQLAADGAQHYYRVRDRFNQHGSSLDFLFLNRACFNGVMRFNRQGQFNVPFCRKPHRFTPAYITKICNQVAWVQQQMQGSDWELRVASWDEIFADVQATDFVYLDPPYIGRHTDYYNTWTSMDAVRLAAQTRSLAGGYALSMWLENQYRRNAHIHDCWQDMDIRLYSHFYHVGAHELLRHSMTEALVIKPGYGAPLRSEQLT
ncbi:MAG: Dam family site-specific DNA-(adenine-N6)-methyltransferase [Cyanobacteria bacterium]|nr:Dam family site-specific DNA-(adenine-N6)-methyltransferase [Cyanobacteriota bacterium]MDW8202081.1 Dam family site-specific DNA-(adenine-N6)-methyltransferase [Cyanobacteriota bacterium SKYGB_h_bin112]